MLERKSGMLNKWRKNNNQTKKEMSFIRVYKWWIIVSVASLIAIYFLTYYIFLGNGIFKTGTGLKKNDWLEFLGEYLSFAGTLIISLVAILQSRFYIERDNQRIVDERKKTVQPVLSISIINVDSMVIGTSEVFSLTNQETKPSHKNVTIEIENAGQYPICNVIVFDKYMWQLLKPNDKKQIQVAYSDSPDIQHWKEHLLEILDTEYERTESGIPKSFNVNYDNVDGIEMFQTYELKEFDGKKYYSLSRIEEVFNA